MTCSLVRLIHVLHFQFLHFQRPHRDLERDQHGNRAASWSAAVATLAAWLLIYTKAAE